MYDLGDQDWARFQAQIRAATGIRLEDYKPEQMRRRIAAMASRAGWASFQSYFELLEREPEEMETFLSRFTIHVSELFRNPERFAELRESVLPRVLADRTAPATTPF